MGRKMRVFVIVGGFAIIALSAGMFVFGRGQSSSEASPGTATAPAIPPGRLTLTTKAPARKAPATPPPPAAAAPKVVKPARPALRKPKVAVVTPPARPGDQLPAAIRIALAANRVVVVSLYDPKAKIDGTALREAQAGAQLAATTFVPIDVTKNDVAALNARYGVIQDPAVLVLRPPGDLVVRIDGFADRDTVAQAAANAAS